MTIESTLTRGEAEIQTLLADYLAAVCAKDLDRVLGHYAAEVVTFDLKPPFQLTGRDAVRAMWEDCLPCFPDGSLTPVVRDVRVTAGDDVAAVHWIMMFAGWPKDHPAAEMWMRGTAVYKRIGGAWQIVHDHVSQPFDFIAGSPLTKC